MEDTGGRKGERKARSGGENGEAQEEDQGEEKHQAVSAPEAKSLAQSERVRASPFRKSPMLAKLAIVTAEIKPRNGND
jgi:hypothetical protein